MHHISFWKSTKAPLTTSAILGPLGFRQYVGIANYMRRVSQEDDHERLKMD
jgi:hypothetical protein